MVMDLSRRGRPLGVEIIEPHLVSLKALNRVLKQYGHAPVKSADLTPLKGSIAKLECQILTAGPFREADMRRAAILQLLQEPPL